MMRRIGLYAACFVAQACGSSPESEPQRTITWRGKEGEPTDAVLFENVLLVGAQRGGKPGARLVADTGSPVVILSPDSYAVPAAKVSEIDGFAVGGLTFDNVQVLGADVIQSSDPETPLGGVLGCTILCHFSTTFDYRDARLVLGEGPPPEDVESAVDVPFDLEGGGIGEFQGVSGLALVPRSRISVSVTIEGTKRPFLIDTGASVNLLRADIFDALASDGRGQVPALTSSTQGVTVGSFMRLRSVMVGGAEVDGAAAEKDEAVEALLDAMEAEVGHPIQGLIGGSFLREFMVTVDYPNDKLVLRRYTTRDHIVDEFVRVGFAMDASAPDHPVLVATVLPSTDAATKLVAVGDEVVGVDGQALADLSEFALDQILVGKPGTKHAIEFGTTKAASLDHQTVDIAVDDVIPLP